MFSLTKTRFLLPSLCKASFSTTAFPNQKIIAFFGAPGVGKGTYSRLLCKDLKLNPISIGDELRKIIKGQVPSTFDPNLLKQIKEIVQSGKLVDDEIVFKILEEKMKEPASAVGVVLDGFPRTLKQLEKLQEKFKVDLVLNIELNYEILLEKLLGRRVCANCGQSYNICDINKGEYVMPPLLPKKEGTCDECGGHLIQRDDDTEAVISNRMKEYNEKTHPILDKYRQLNICIDIELKKGVAEYPRLLKVVKDNLKL